MKRSLSLSRSVFFVFLARCRGVERTTLHRHRCSLVALQAQMMPGFHGDGGAKRSRRPVCTPFPSFCLPRRLGFGQARLVGCGATDQYRLAHNRQAGGFLQCFYAQLWSSSRAFSHFYQQRWEGEGSAAAGNFSCEWLCECVCARVCTCAHSGFRRERRGQPFFFFFSSWNKSRDGKKRKISTKNIMFA